MHPLLSRQILDVRSLHEFRHFNLPGAINIPIDELILRHRELQHDLPYTIVCAHGVRSITATEYLQSKGYDVVSLPGGLASINKETSLSKAKQLGFATELL